MSDDASVHEPRLGARVLRGLGWKAISIAVTQGTRIVVLVLLARLLSPADFGLAGMVLVVSGLVFILADLSLGAALVQRRELHEDDRSTVFWLSLAVGAFLAAAGVALSGLVAFFYGEPEVRALFAAISATFLLASLGTVQEALMIRDMRFRELEIRQMAAAIAGGVVGVAVALAGGGAWAIILQQITVFAMGTMLLWLTARWRPHFRFSFERLRVLGTFGGNVLGSRLLFFAPRNLDNLLIGRFLGPAALGAYALAYNVSQMPLSLVAGPLDQVMYPAFSRLQNDIARLRSAFGRALRLICLVVAPTFVGIAVVAPDGVPLVFGDQWTPAVLVLQLLAVVGLIQSLQALNHSVLQARDRSSHLLRYAVVFAVATMAAIVVGLPFGIVGVATGLLVVSLLIEPAYLVIVARALETSAVALARNVAPGILAACAMGAVVLGLRETLLLVEVPRAPRLGACIVAGAVAYGVAAKLLAPASVGDLVTLVRSRMGARGPVTPGTSIPSEVSVAAPSPETRDGGVG